MIALVPAAGSARRMGAPKLALPYAGTTVLGATLKALREGGCSRIVVVTAPWDAPLRDWAVRHDVETAINPDPDRGMLSSLLAGLDALGGAPTLTVAGQALLVSPGDVPRLAASTVRAVANAVAKGGSPIAVPRFAGRNGHPMGIAGHCIAEIPALDPTVGLRQLRDRHAASVAWIDVDDPGCAADVDTPADYEALLRRG